MYALRSMRRGWLIFGLASPLAIAFACSGGDNAPPLGGATDDGGGGDDRSTSKDGQPPSDGKAPTPTTYNDLTDKTKWSFFDFGLLYPALDGAPFAGPSGFLGAIFDGRFIYYAPTGNKTLQGVSSNAFDIIRFDISKPFDDASSFTKSDVSYLGSNVAFIGGAFDGRFVDFAPYQGSPFLRYDTTGSFQDASAGWQAPANSTIANFGSAFGNGAVYYAPLSTDQFQRLDVRDSGLQSFSLAGADGGAPAYEGVSFDGKYAYFAPTGTDLADAGESGVVRVDTTKDFTSPVAWDLFDTHQVDALTGNFAGTLFDGRYVYFVPTTPNAGTPVDSRFVRFDSQGSFTDAAAWSVFAPGPSATSGYHTAAFDGRFVYFLPFIETGSSSLLRYDSTQPFTDSASWTYFPLDTFNPNATGFEGMGFDGEYMYFVPRYGHVAARFDTKAPASIPPGFSGSFL
jgi:hypothetical protein